MDRSRRELDIIIAPAKDDILSKSKRRSNPGYQIPEDDIGRRRKAKKGKIKIYDMGRKWNGSIFADVDFHYLPFAYSTSSANNILTGLASVSFALSRFTALKDYIIDYDPAIIDTMHPQLGSADDSNLFDFLFLDDAGIVLDSEVGTSWTLSGWAVPQSVLDSATLSLTPAVFSTETGHFLNWNLFYQINFRGSHPHKFTTIYDPTAPSVPFTLTLGDSVFLMPIMTKPVFFQNYADNVEYPPGSGFVSRNIVDYFTGDAMVAPRSRYLDPLDENYRDGLFDGYNDSAPVPSIYFEKRIRLIQNHGFNQIRRRAYFVHAFGWQWEIMDPTRYPHAYDTTTDDDVTTFQAYWTGEDSRESIPGHGAVPSKALLAIIKRETTLFFVWMP